MCSNNREIRNCGNCRWNGGFVDTAHSKCGHGLEYNQMADEFDNLMTVEDWSSCNKHEFHGEGWTEANNKTS